jgi:hypothetical protein
LACEKGNEKIFFAEKNAFRPTEYTMTNILAKAGV